MFDRIDLKRRARLTIKKNYGVMVLVAFILSLVSGTLAISGAGAYQSESKSISEVIVSVITFHFLESLIAGFKQFFLMLLVISVISLLLNIFLLNPIRVGCIRFFILNTSEKPTASELLYAFRNNYFNIIKVMFLKDLFTFLWSLLFVIPGLIKSYSYRMVPYLLAENPNLSPGDAIQASMDMMFGFKLSTFILDLSFFGWILLSSFTMGLSGVLYSNPYAYATSAELYNLLSGSDRVRTHSFHDFQNTSNSNNNNPF